MSRYALPLKGWDDYSLWGYDSQGATYFAQLWRNESDWDDDPDVTLNWFTRRAVIDTPLALAQLIAARTSVSVGTVLRAMATAKSAPEVPSLSELADVMATPCL